MKNKIQRIYSNGGDYIRATREIKVTCPYLAVILTSIDINIDPAYVCLFTQPVDMVKIETCLKCKNNPYAKED